MGSTHINWNGKILYSRILEGLDNPPNILTPIVDYHEFYVAIGLIQYTLDGYFEEFRPVMGSKNYRD
jgi:hypothetical protein